MASIARAEKLQAELQKLGAQVETTETDLVIDPPARVTPARIATYEDHRMAMSFAVAGLAVGYPEAKEPLSARLSLSATVHTDRYDAEAVERELDAYDARRGRDWSGDKVKQYSKVMRGDFGEHVARKRFRLA